MPLELFIANLSSRIRKTREGGRLFYVAHATLLVPGVLRGSKGPLFYPPDEVAANVRQWHGQPITNGHPRIDGDYVSAWTEGLQWSYWMGEVRNPVFNSKLKSELWFDYEHTKRIEPRIIQKLERGETIELSTGLFTKNYPVNNANFRGLPYTAVARHYKADHLAVLLNTRGACSLADGCGVLVNQLNSGPPAEETFLKGLFKGFFSRCKPSTGTVVNADSYFSSCPRDSGGHCAPSGASTGSASIPGGASGTEPIHGVKLYHGGTGEEGKFVTYYTTSHSMAQSYVGMHEDRFGKTGKAKVHEKNVTIARPAPAHVIETEAKKAGIDNEIYTPAGVFDGNLHGDHEVKKLVDSLKRKGYDGAMLEDIPYGGNGEVERAYITFTGAMKPQADAPTTVTQVNKPKSTTQPRPSYKVGDKVKSVLELSSVVLGTGGTGRAKWTDSQGNIHDVRKRPGGWHIVNSHQRGTEMDNDTVRRSFWDALGEMMGFIDTNGGSQDIRIAGGGDPSLQEPAANTYLSDKLDMTPEKACKILKDGMVHGKALTKRQRGMFGALCGKRRKPAANEGDEGEEINPVYHLMDGDEDFIDNADVSLQDRAMKVYRAFRDAHPVTYDSQTGMQDSYCTLREVFDDYVIYDEKGDLYRQSYSWDDRGEPVLEDDSTEVRAVTEYVTMEATTDEARELLLDELWPELTTNELTTSEFDTLWPELAAPEGLNINQTGDIDMAAKLNDFQRKQIVDGLVANCSCAGNMPWKGKTAQALSALSDETLMMMDQTRKALESNTTGTPINGFIDGNGNVHVQNAATKEWSYIPAGQRQQVPIAQPVGNQQGGGTQQTQGAGGQQVQTPAVPVVNAGGGGGGHPKTMEDWLKLAPVPNAAEMFQTVMEIHNNEKQRLVEEIIGNSSFADETHQQAAVQLYSGKEVPELRLIAASMPKKQEQVANNANGGGPIGNWLGAAGGFRRETPTINETPLLPPKYNFHNSN